MPSKNTKKKLKESARSQQPPKVEEQAVAEVVATEGIVQEVATPVEQPKVEEQKQQPKQEKKKEKKPSKIKTKSKELVSELKKVTWPTFKQVAKKTGVVLVVVAVFALVLLGIHELLQLVYSAFIANVK